MGIQKVNKKGSVQDVFFIAGFVFLIAITFVIGWMMMSKLNENIQVSTFSDSGKQIVANTNNKYVSWFDGIFLTVFLLLWAITLILAYQIDTQPVFFIFTIVIFGILAIITAVLGNTFYDFASNAGISDYASAFTIIPFVMNNYVQAMVVCGFSVALVIYAKVRG